MGSLWVFSGISVHYQWDLCAFSVGSLHFWRGSLCTLSAVLAAGFLE